MTRCELLNLAKTSIVVCGNLVPYPVQSMDTLLYTRMWAHTLSPQFQAGQELISN